MSALAADPFIQSAVAPFAVALIAGLLLYRAGWQWAGLAVWLGFVTAAWLIMGFQFHPLTSARKILALGLVAAPFGLILGLYNGNGKGRAVLLAACGAAALLWVIWPVAVRKEWPALALLAGGAIVFGGWQVAALDGLWRQGLRAGVAALMLALAAGLSALLGASALFGQLASAIAAAAGAYVLLALFSRALSAGPMLTFPVGLLCGLISFSAMVYAKLPWTALPCMALIPLLARVPLPAGKLRWLQVLVLVLATAPAAAAAIWLTWRAAGGLPPL